MRSLWPHRNVDTRVFTVIHRDGGVEIAHGKAGRIGRALSSADVQRLSQLLRSEMVRGVKTLVVDLAADDHVDTSLIAVLLDARRTALHRGAVLVMHGSPALHRLAAVCRVEEVLALD